MRRVYAHEDGEDGDVPRVDGQDENDADEVPDHTVRLVLHEGRRRMSARVEAESDIRVTHAFL